MTKTNAAAKRPGNVPAGAAKVGHAEAATLRAEPAKAGTDNGAAVVVRGLRKQYGPKAAVGGVDLTIPAGQIVALLGPNGAGKTTTVEILAGRRRRDGGEVRVLGADPERAGRAWRARIGVVPQTPLAASEFTVREVVAQFAAYFPDPRDPDEVIEAVGLTGQAGRRLRRLSGGQRRRADVAVGLVGRPELLFLDEPTTGFDPQARRRFWDLIAGLAAGGTTILLTTHYLDEAAALASRVAVLAGGQIVADGTPEELRHAGTDGVVATVSWDTPAGRRTVRTANPTAAVLDLADQDGAELPGLTVTRPSLEDVYLELIGAGRAAGAVEEGDQR
jgi:ABC-2 type transport system ATP-binding protein